MLAGVRLMGLRMLVGLSITCWEVWRCHVLPVACVQVSSSAVSRLVLPGVTAWCALVTGVLVLVSCLPGALLGVCWSGVVGVPVLGWMRFTCAGLLISSPALWPVPTQSRVQASRVV